MLGVNALTARRPPETGHGIHGQRPASSRAVAPPPRPGASPVRRDRLEASPPANGPRRRPKILQRLGGAKRDEVRVRFRQLTWRHPPTASARRPRPAAPRCAARRQRRGRSRGGRPEGAKRQTPSRAAPDLRARARIPTTSPRTRPEPHTQRTGRTCFATSSAAVPAPTSVCKPWGNGSPTLLRSSARRARRRDPQSATPPAPAPAPPRQRAPRGRRRRPRAASGMRPESPPIEAASPPHGGPANRPHGAATAISLQQGAPASGPTSAAWGPTCARRGRR
mmetsp:Transcript_131526/g.420753  ORF Transcript_131526/g.420753 Transcript_131526/m.420753 type:complete len:280 (-) Transcript_131526:412-1251(-)